MTALNLAQASDLNLAQASELLLNITHTTATGYDLWVAFHCSSAAFNWVGAEWGLSFETEFGLRSCSIPMSRIFVQAVPHGRYESLRQLAGCRPEPARATCLYTARHLRPRFEAMLFGGPVLLTALISVAGTVDRVGAVADGRFQQRQTEKLSRVPANLVLSEPRKALAIAEVNAKRECSAPRKCSGLEDR
jgi:hypothetical protein